MRATAVAMSEAHGVKASKRNAITWQRLKKRLPKPRQKSTLLPTATLPQKVQTMHLSNNVNRVVPATAMAATADNVATVVNATAINLRRLSLTLNLRKVPLPRCR